MIIMMMDGMYVYSSTGGDEDMMRVYTPLLLEMLADCCMYIFTHHHHTIAFGCPSASSCKDTQDH